MIELVFTIIVIGIVVGAISFYVEKDINSFTLAGMSNFCFLLGVMCIFLTLGSDPQEGKADRVVSYCDSTYITWEEKDNLPIIGEQLTSVIVITPNEISEKVETNNAVYVDDLEEGEVPYLIHYTYYRTPYNPGMEVWEYHI